MKLNVLIFGAKIQMMRHFMTSEWISQSSKDETFLNFVNNLILSITQCTLGREKN